MKNSWLFRLAGLLLPFTSAMGAQSQLEYAPPTKTPAAAAVDSYAIYSQLLPGNEIEWGSVPRKQWLVEAVTTAVPAGTDCNNKDAMNPHTAIHPPESRKVEFDEVLADFDSRCHARYQLDRAGFHVALPLRLLSEDDRNRYTREISGHLPPPNNIMQAPPPPDDFKGAAGLHSFTAVYFNRAHTLALTEIGMFCGSSCGNWTWVVLERTSAGWRPLLWPHTEMMS